MKRKLIVLVGVSGSGKSTYANKLFLKNPKDVVIVSRDNLRKLISSSSNDNLSDYYNLGNINKLENLVSELEHELIESLLSRDKIVIIDNTNLKLKYLRNYSRYEVPTQLVMFNILLEEALRIDKKRTDNIGEDTIRNQFRKLDILYKNLFSKEFEFTNVDIEALKNQPRFSLSHPVFQNKKEKYKANIFLPRCIIVDIDGTLAEKGDRSPYDMDKVDKDLVRKDVADFVRAIYKSGVAIILCSGRNEGARKLTEQWLKNHRIPYNKLLMRKDNDYRKDYIVKEELWNIIGENYYIIGMIDDRKQVVDNARELGYTVFQVSNNNF